MICKKSTLQWSLLSISINLILSVFGWMMVVQALKHLRRYITYKVCIKVLIRQFVAKYWVRVSFSMSKGLIVWFGEVIFQKFWILKGLQNFDPTRNCGTCCGWYFDLVRIGEGGAVMGTNETLFTIYYEGDWEGLRGTEGDRGQQRGTGGTEKDRRGLRGI